MARALGFEPGIKVLPPALRADRPGGETVYSPLMAGVLGFEPRIAVLETTVIPFHHTPMSSILGLLNLFVQGVLLFPLTIFFQLNLILKLLLVSLRVIVDVLAHRTLEFDQVVLGHRVC